MASIRSLRAVKIGAALLLASLATHACAGSQGQDAGVWEEVESPTTQQLDAIWGAAADDIWAVGHGGVAIHYDGAAWTASSTGTSAVLYSVWGAPSGKFWAGGDDTMIRWEGGQWVPDPWFTGRSIAQIRGSGADDVWVALSAESVLAHWDGASWSEVAAPEDEFISALWVPAPGQVWAMGLERGVYRRSAGAWEFFELPDEGGVWIGSSLSGCGPDDLWATANVVGAAGGGAVAYHWDGATWTSTSFYADPAVVPATLDAGFCRAPGDVWMVGGFASYRGDEAGWEHASVDAFLSEVWVSATEAWAVGSVGAILRAPAQ